MEIWRKLRYAGRVEIWVHGRNMKVQCRHGGMVEMWRNGSDMEVW